jgi:hypothetical protein
MHTVQRMFDGRRWVFRDEGRGVQGISPGLVAWREL